MAPLPLVPFARARDALRFSFNVLSVGLPIRIRPRQALAGSSSRNRTALPSPGPASAIPRRCAANPPVPGTALTAFLIPGEAVLAPNDNRQKRRTITPFLATLLPFAGQRLIFYGIAGTFAMASSLLIENEPRRPPCSCPLSKPCLRGFCAKSPHLFPVLWSMTTNAAAETKSASRSTDTIHVKQVTLTHSRQA